MTTVQTGDQTDVQIDNQVRPACEGSVLEQWFSTLTVDVVSCLEVCSTCPVRRTCLDGAIARGEQYGIWGGRLFLPKRTLRELERTKLRHRGRVRMATATARTPATDHWSAGLDGAA